MTLGKPLLPLFQVRTFRRAGARYCHAASIKARRAGALPILVMPPLLAIITRGVFAGHQSGDNPSTGWDAQSG